MQVLLNLDLEDLFLPLNSKIDVKLNQTVKGGETIISQF